MTECFNKSPLQIQNSFLQLIERYKGFDTTYSDASKIENAAVQIEFAVFIKENQL